jgi:hypothetical protein
VLLPALKTTLEIRDAIFRRTKSVAAGRGIPLRAHISEALADNLRTDNGSNKPRITAFGRLRHLRRENRENQTYRRRRIRPDRVLLDTVQRIPRSSTSDMSNNQCFSLYRAG